MRKSIYSLTAAALIAASSLSACSGTSAQTTAAESSAVSEDETNGETSKETATESADNTETNAGENQDAAPTADSDTDETLSEKETAELYRGFARTLQTVIGSKHMDDLAELLVYPAYIGIDDGIVVNNRNDFMALDADKVFTDALIEAVKAADIDSIELTEAGFIVGAPSGKPAVTLGLDKEGSMGITGINY